MTGDCGDPVRKLVYFKCANCLPDMLDMHSDNSYCVVARLLHVYTFSVLKSYVQTEIAKVSVYMCEYTERELYNWSLTLEVILCTDYICWFTCLLIPYFNQQNALNKYNRADHKTLHIRYQLLSVLAWKCHYSGRLLKTKDHMSNTCFWH